jgi:hypothetical protein
LQHYTLDEAVHADIARELGTSRGRVRLEVAAGSGSSKLLIGDIAEEAVLEVVWPGLPPHRGGSVRYRV